jgi:hypothetical protein
MELRGHKLQSAIEKWIGPQRVQVVRLGRSGRGKARRIPVEIERPSRPFAIFFFRHEDGSWQVFPPSDSQQPEINEGRDLRHAASAL